MNTQLFYRLKSIRNIIHVFMRTLKIDKSDTRLTTNKTILKLSFMRCNFIQKSRINNFYKMFEWTKAQLRIKIIIFHLFSIQFNYKKVITSWIAAAFIIDAKIDTTIIPILNTFNNWHIFFIQFMEFSQKRNGNRNSQN